MPLTSQARSITASSAGGAVASTKRSSSHREAQDAVQVAPELRCVGELACGLWLDQPVVARGLEDGDRVAGEHLLGLGRMQQLEVLRDELGIDQAAALLLDRPDVVAGIVAAQVFAQARDLGGEVLCLMRLSEGGAARLLEALAQLALGPDHARPGERLKLPGRNAGSKMLDEGRERGDDGPGVARGTRPHVHVVERALRRRRTDRRDVAPAELPVVAVGPERLAPGRIPRRSADGRKPA